MVGSPKSLPKIMINPRLGMALGVEESNDSELTINLSALPSAYAKKVHRHRKAVPKDYQENKHWLTCRGCNRRREYDLGLIAVDLESLDIGQGGTVEHIGDHIQFTGYFRCKYCNAGDEWSFGNEFIIFLVAAMTQQSVGAEATDLLVQFGRFQSFDGHEPKSAMDAEEHLLDLIAEKPDDTFLWNRLGNVYRRGGVPELAVVAYEQSLRYDITQFESNVSLADILYHIGEIEASIHHAHIALAHARFYTNLDSAERHEMACVLLRNLLDASMALDNTNLFLPPQELMQDAALQHGKPEVQLDDTLDYRSFDLHLDDIESFASLADVYLGSLGRTRKRAGSRHHKKKKKRKR